MISEGQFEIPSWNDIYEMLLNLAEKIRNDNYYPDILIGISRGGLVPARVISDLLGNPNLATVGVEFYSGLSETKKWPILTHPISKKVTGKNLLMIDDVSDTGKSLKLVKDHIEKKCPNLVKSATIYRKSWSKTIPDYYSRKTKKWVVFPWECKETIQRLYKNNGKNGTIFESIEKKLVEEGMGKDLVKRLINEVLRETR